MTTDSVLITGAGSGIGLATALLLAERGFRVYATIPDLSQQEQVDAAAREHDVDLHVMQLDVTDPQSIQATVDTILKEAGAIYGVVHSAGLGLRGFFEDLSDQEIRRLFDVNVFGVMTVTRMILPHMRRARRGRIAIISSAGGRTASMTISVYCASKFALEGFGESLALEVAPLGLHVSLIEPGLVMTPHFTVNRGRAAAAADPASLYYAWFAQHERVVDDILRTGRIAPTDVAQAVHRALTAKRPKLRYVVGRGARLLLSLRRHLPGELFERLYFGHVVRMVTDPRRPAAGLSELSSTDVTPAGRLGDSSAGTEADRDG